MTASTGGVAFRIRRVLTTRAGGCSVPPYDSFNLGDHVGDDPMAVAANRRRLASETGLGGGRVVWMEQLHTRTVTVVGTADADDDAPVAATDGLVTATPGLGLAVLTADCVPMLLGDPSTGVVAAVHAGRVGARSGIVASTMAAMVSAGARSDRTEVLLGPAVCGACYEVPAEMRDDVDAHVPGSATVTRDGTPGLDLRAGLRRQLLRAGVAGVAADPRCTVESRELYSHRRGAPTGRLAGVIWAQPR